MFIRGFEAMGQRCAALVVAVLLVILIPAEGRADLRVPPAAPVVAPPAYPAAGDGEPAHVTWLLLINADGSVAQAELVSVDREGEAGTPFVDAARAHVLALRMVPATVDGRPVAARIRMVIAFAPPAVVVEEGGAEADSGSVPESVPVSDSIPVSDADPSFAATAEVSLPERPRASAGDFEIHLGRLRDVPRRATEGLLSLAPGVLLANHSGELHASSVFLRGFDAGEGQDIAFSLEGIPLNEISNAHGHGYADTHFIIPELVEAVRVVEGPFDPRQGDFAVAGSVDFSLGLERRGVDLIASYGSFRARRLTLLWGPEEERKGTFVGVELRAGDGFGPNRAYAGVAAMARYEAEVGEHALASVLLFSQAGRFDSAGVIRQDDFEARRLPCAGDEDSQFYCTYDPNQGGSLSRHGAAATLRYRKGDVALVQRLSLGVRRMRFRENFTGYSLDPMSDGSPQRGDGLDEAYAATTFFAEGSYAHRLGWRGRAQRFVVGYSVRYDTADSSQTRLRTVDEAPYERVFDVGVDVTNLAVYGAVDLRPLRWLALRGGLRLDSFVFGVLDRDRPVLDRVGPRLGADRIDAYGLAVQPRGSVAFALMPELDLVIGIGLGARSSDGTALSDGEFAPFAHVRSEEVGFVYEREGSTSLGAYSLGARLIAFHTYVERDLLFDPARGRNVLSAPSNRAGALLSARLSVGRRIDALLSVTYTEAHVASRDDDLWEIASGPRLPFVPRWVLRGDTAYRHPFRAWGEEFEAGVALGATFVGPKPLPLEALSDSVFTVDASTRLAWRAFELALSAHNLFDARYHLLELNYASSFRDPSAAPSMRAARHFAAGPPLEVFATLTLHLGPRVVAESETDDGDE